MEYCKTVMITIKLISTLQWLHQLLQIMSRRLHTAQF